MYKPSTKPFTAALFSASAEDKDTVACVEHQCLISVPWMQAAPPLVDRLVSLSPHQSGSTKTSSVSGRLSIQGKSCTHLGTLET